MISGNTDGWRDTPTAQKVNVVNNSGEYQNIDEIYATKTEVAVLEARIDTLVGISGDHIDTIVALGILYDNNPTLATDINNLVNDVYTRTEADARYYTQSYINDNYMTTTSLDTNFYGKKLLYTKREIDLRVYTRDYINSN